MIKLTLPILCLIALAAAQAYPPGPTTPVVGGFSPFTNFTDPSFQRVLAAVYKAHPEVGGWAPSNAAVQYVAGTIYNFTLRSPKDSSAVFVSAIDNFIVGKVQILQYSSQGPNVNPPAPPGPNPPLFQNTNPAGSIFKPFTDYSNDSFQKALAQAKSQDYLLFFNNQLVTTDLYVSPRFYYFRFTLSPRQNQNQSPKPAAPPLQIYEIVSFETPVVEAGAGVGRGQSLNINKPGLYHEAYWQMVKTFPKLVRYDVASVKKQIVAGANYYFVMERTYDVYEKVSITVNVDLQNRYQVNAVQDDLSFSYSQEVIEQVRMLASRTWPELQDYGYYQTTNIRSDKTGLRLTYRSLSSNNVRYVDLDLVKGKEALMLNLY